MHVQTDIRSYDMRGVVVIRSRSNGRGDDVREQVYGIMIANTDDAHARTRDTQTHTDRHTHTVRHRRRGQ